VLKILCSKAYISWSESNWDPEAIGVNLKKKVSRDPHKILYSVRITRNTHCAGTFCVRLNVNFSGPRRKYKQGYNAAWNVTVRGGQHKWALHNLTVAERIASWLLAVEICTTEDCIFPALMKTGTVGIHGYKF
jgi:hypothetical protein